MNTIQCELLLDELSRYRAFADDAQRSQADCFEAFIRSCDAPWRRSHLAGHLTASAWIVDEAREHALLVHHKKLDRWLQPGGHVDDDDASLFDAALREAREETGLIDLRQPVANGASPLFDIDVHAIPARRDEPAHFHYDLRYLFTTARSACTRISANESNDLAWFALSAITSSREFDVSVSRMAALTLSGYWREHIPAFDELFQ
jgi:8-oxo-dGTP pyrophosphatase MutT (NUDIX family)